MPVAIYPEYLYDLTGFSVVVNNNTELARYTGLSANPATIVSPSLTATAAQLSDAQVDIKLTPEGPVIVPHGVPIGIVYGK